MTPAPIAIPTGPYDRDTVEGAVKVTIMCPGAFRHLDAPDPEIAALMAENVSLGLG